ncbi:MAG: signal peptidase I [Clostridiales Family XIII bacterium]|jgi:signal peptidase I|nr:signal peptidase I [Clostridiales Family XIII bacterium]
MKISDEQGKRIQALEEELSDERLGKIFSEASADGLRIGGRQKRTLPRGVPAAIVCAAAIVVLAQFFAPAIVDGASMDPALAARDLVLIAKTEYVFGEVEYMDIVVLNTEYKRVAGLPGDHIEMRGGGVYCNGERVNGVSVSESAGDVIVPDHRYFVISDNQGDDGGAWDPNLSLVAKEEMRGKVIFRLLPVSKTGRIH